MPAVLTELSQAQTSLHKCWLGEIGKLFFTLPHQGIDPRVFGFGFRLSNHWGTNPAQKKKKKKKEEEEEEEKEEEDDDDEDEATKTTTTTKTKSKKKKKKICSPIKKLTRLKAG